MHRADLAGHLLESLANRQRALFFKQSLKLLEFLITADGGRSERVTETTLPICLFCLVKLNRKPLTDEATRSRGIYGKHGRILEKCYHCQYHWCESEDANRLSLIFSLSVRRKPVNLSSHGILAALSLSLPCSFLLFICNKRPVSLTSCKALSISVSLFDLIPSSSPPPCLLLLDSVVIPG